MKGAYWYAESQDVTEVVFTMLLVLFTVAPMSHHVAIRIWLAP